jgi:diacylglycerol kinase family enzyme
MRGVPDTASIAVIVNASAKAADGHAEIARELDELFRAAGCGDTSIARCAGQELTAAARDASARASIVAAAGGDGTVSSVAAGIIDSPAALGIVPLGTLNHFAKDLGIPLDRRRAVEVIAARHRAPVDVGQVNGRVFVNNVSIGLYPDIVEEREVLRRRGHGKWAAMGIATLRVLRRYRGVTVRVVADGRERTWQTPFVFVGNNEYTTDGIRLGSRTRLDQGRQFIYLAPRARTRDLPMLLAKALAGRVRESDAFEVVSAAEVSIATRTTRRLRVAVDGEVTTMTAPLTFCTRPGALQVVVPQD